MASVSEPVEASEPSRVWASALEILRCIEPGFDVSLVEKVFADVVRLFRGEYPGYRKIRTPYHDLTHTLDVFVCAVRLMHGARVAGHALSQEDMARGMVAALFHDIGYAQEAVDDSGTGAQYTPVHVQRGIGFMGRYLPAKGVSLEFIHATACIMLATDHRQGFAAVTFPDEHTALMGRLVGTADLVGQMADRQYLEKLLFLYFEFREAQVGDFGSMQELLRRTGDFYQTTRKRLDEEFGGAYQLLAQHFKAYSNVERNFYMESIAKNLDYLDQVIRQDEADYLSMLKRGGIAEQAVEMARSAGYV